MLKHWPGARFCFLHKLAFESSLQRLHLLWQWISILAWNGGGDDAAVLNVPCCTEYCGCPHGSQNCPDDCVPGDDCHGVEDCVLKGICRPCEVDVCVDDDGTLRSQEEELGRPPMGACADVRAFCECNTELFEPCCKTCSSTPDVSVRCDSSLVCRQAEAFVHGFLYPTSF